MSFDKNIVRFPIFRDDYGNRFVFPTIHDHNETLPPTYRWAWCRQAEIALTVTEEEENLSVEIDSEGFMNFTHVVTTCGSRGFEHGAETVWLVGGPEFDSFIARGAD